MGCSHSTCSHSTTICCPSTSTAILEREKMVSTCKRGKSLMEEFVRARTEFSASYNRHLMSLRNTGAALVQFATAESTASISESERQETAVDGRLLEAIKRLNENFVQAADSGRGLAAFLEVETVTFPGGQTASGKVPHPFSSSGSSSPSSPGSHRSTVERLLECETKLSNAKRLNLELKNEEEQVQNLELKRADYMKAKENAKEESEKIERRIEDSRHMITSISKEIVDLTENQLYPQLVELVKGLRSMWRSLFESHKVQIDILKQLNYNPSTAAATENLLQSTRQLKLKVQEWHGSFSNLIKSQWVYIQSLIGWLNLSLVQLNKKPSKNKQIDAFSTLFKVYKLVIPNDNARGEDALKGKDALKCINTFSKAINRLLIYQSLEMKLKKRADMSNESLQAIESKYGSGDEVADKNGKVKSSKAKAKEDKVDYELAKKNSMEMMSNILPIGFLSVLEEVMKFAEECTHSFEEVTCEEG